MIQKPIRLIELFAGIGSQAMALRDIGANFDTYRVIEFDKYAIQSYNAIHGTNFSTMDITKIHAEDLGITNTESFDYIVTYSFPCQDLSVAGKQAGMQKNSGTRSGLLWEVERLLTECTELPQTLVMENVTQVHGKKNAADFKKWLAFLESLGYKNYYQDMNAKDYGIPQNRNRCFMISKLDAEPYIFPQPQELEHAMRDYLEPRVDDKYYLSDKMFKYALNIDNAAPGVGYSDSVDNSYINPIVAHTIGCASATGQRSGTTNYVDDKKEPMQVGELKRCLQVGSVNIGNNESNNRVYSPAACCPTLNTMQGGHRQPKILEKVDRVGGVLDKENKKHQRGSIYNASALAPTLDTMQGGLAQPLIIDKAHKVLDIPKEILNDNERQRRVYATDGLSPSVLARSDSAKILEGLQDYKIRKLTPLECWRLMGFTDADFDKAAGVCSNTQLYKQAGNSIVKNVLMALFNSLIKGAQ